MSEKDYYYYVICFFKRQLLFLQSGCNLHCLYLILQQLLLQSKMQLALLPMFSILMFLIKLTAQFSISSQNPSSASSFDSEAPNFLAANYTSNMTEEELKYITNSISSAERRYNQSQLTQIAELMAKNLATVFNKSWTVIVLGKGVTRIGVGAFAYQSKMASFIKAGSYQLSYVALQKSGCLYPNSSINNSNTNTSQKFSEYLTNSNISYLKAVVSSASTYGGNDIQQNSVYMKNMIRKNIGSDWNAIIVEPAVISSSYICATYNRWATFIKYIDFGWNYYLFSGDYNN